MSTKYINVEKGLRIMLTNRKCSKLIGLGWADDACRMKEVLTFRYLFLAFTCCSCLGENNWETLLFCYPQGERKTNRKISEEHELFSYSSSNFLSYVLSSWITQPDSVFGNMCWASWGLGKDSRFFPIALYLANGEQSCVWDELTRYITVMPEHQVRWFEFKSY